MRRANLKRLLDLRYGGNQSALGRTVDPEKGSQSRINDLLNGRKSFGEKMASKIEDRTGLADGQLSIPDSPLEMRASSANVDAAITGIMALMTQEQKQELLTLAAGVLHRSKRPQPTQPAQPSKPAPAVPLRQRRAQ